MDVFFCTCPKTKEREEIAFRCLDWWKRQHVNLYVLTPKLLECTREQFNRERRIQADLVARGDYILTDDDCLPANSEGAPLLVSQFTRSLYRAMEVFKNHFDFAVLSFWPENAVIHRWTPEDYSPYEDLEVMEHVSVGGIRVCQKNHILNWPKSEGLGYDLTQSDYVRSIGKRVGYFQHHRMIHYGEAKSELWTSPALSLTAAP